MVARVGVLPPMKAIKNLKKMPGGKNVLRLVDIIWTFVGLWSCIHLEGYNMGWKQLG